MPGFRSFLGPDLAITSWADLGLQELDWGAAVGGGGGSRAESVKVLKAQFGGLCIVLPRLMGGGDGDDDDDDDDERGLDVLVVLREEHLERLKGDEVFWGFCAVVG